MEASHWIALLVKAVNNVLRKKPPEPPPAATPEEVLLLLEIRNLLAQRA